MVMTSDETQIQIFANRPMPSAKRVTKDIKDNRKNPEYHVVAKIRRRHVKNDQHFGSKKTYSPKNTESLNTMMKRTTFSFAILLLHCV